MVQSISFVAFSKQACSVPFLIKLDTKESFEFLSGGMGWTGTDSSKRSRQIMDLQLSQRKRRFSTSWLALKHRSISTDKRGYREVGRSTALSRTPRAVLLARMRHIETNLFK